jgi:hypothetical protein
MKWRLMRNWLLLPVVAYCLPLSHAAVINFSSAQYRVAPEDTLSVPIWISGIPSGMAVGAYDLTVNFDPRLLNYQRFIFSNFLGDPEFQAFTEAYPPPAGQLEATLISFLSPAQLQALHQPSSFEIGIIVLTATSLGQSSISVSGLASDAFGNPIDLTFQSSIINGPVPEPATFPLLLFGLTAIAVFALRRRPRRI